MASRLNFLTKNTLKIQFFAPWTSENDFRIGQADVKNDIIYKVNSKYVDKGAKFVASRVFIYNENILVLLNDIEYKFYGIRNKEYTPVLGRLGGQKLVTKDTVVECLYDLNYHYNINRFKIARGSIVLCEGKTEVYSTEKEDDKIKVHKYLSGNLKHIDKYVIPKELFKFKVYNIK